MYRSVKIRHYPASTNWIAEQSLATTKNMASLATTKNTLDGYTYNHMTKNVLSIAGFDGSGGAGIQADLKTFAALGCYGTTVLTALPIQNTMGVKKCYEIPIQAIQDQLETIFEDIIPDAIKIGMLSNTAVIETVSKFLILHAANIPIVLDPVMVATSGDSLLQSEAINALKTQLIPLSTIITPNLAEATVLTGLLVNDIQTMPEVAESLLKLGPQAVLLKGGHLPGEKANDFFLSSVCHPEERSKLVPAKAGKGSHASCAAKWLEGKKINTKNTHGTGCTLSSAIAAHLALEFDLLESCQRSKIYLQNAIEAARDQSLGHGAGPVDHFWE